MRRGEQTSARLDRALELARLTGEAQRLVPVAAAHAESAWLGDQTETMTEVLDLAWSAAVQHPQGWELGELAWWSALAGVSRKPPIPLAAPFAAMLAGEWREAAAEWQQLQCPVWAAMALGQSAELEDARRSQAILDRVGAPAVHQAVSRSRFQLGLPVPRAPRATSRANPSRLTSRELEVLELLVAGHSNSGIAQLLFLSDKTVGHHVSAILRKLGEPTRARAVASAMREGLVRQN
jgi:DNA-binding CsgD family transcriptional regulator